MISGAGLLLIASALGLALGAPWESDASDSQIVQSLIREVRAAPEHVQELVNPDTQNAYLHKYDDGDGDEQGYNKRSEDEGGKGYKHFDSYHKKDGDKYGFQHETSYGLENKDGGAASARGGKYVDENEREEKGAARSADGEAEADEDEGAETRNTYKVVEDVGEDYDAGAGSGGNYDEADAAGHYEESADGEDEGGRYAEGDDDGEAGEYNASEGGDADGDGDGESEHYEADEGDDDY